jgi:hypothetical protein
LIIPWSIDANGSALGALARAPLVFATELDE